MPTMPMSRMFLHTAFAEPNSLPRVGSPTFMLSNRLAVAYCGCYLEVLVAGSNANHRNPTRSVPTLSHLGRRRLNLAALFSILGKTGYLSAQDGVPRRVDTGTGDVNTVIWQPLFGSRTLRRTPTCE